jgi:hypothetical protein
MEKAALSDLLNYEVDSYLSKDEITLIQSVFRGNPQLMRVLRKILLPYVGDQDLPPEEMGSDIWLIGRDYSMMPNEEVKSVVLARQEVIKFILGGLVKLKVIANTTEETATQKKWRETRNSAK